MGKDWDLGNMLLISKTSDPNAGGPQTTLEIILFCRDRAIVFYPCSLKFLGLADGE